MSFVKLTETKEEFDELSKSFIKLPKGKCEMCGKENVYILKGLCKECLDRFNSKIMDGSR